MQSIILQLNQKKFDWLKVDQQNKSNTDDDNFKLLDENIENNFSKNAFFPS